MNRRLQFFWGDLVKFLSIILTFTIWVSILSGCVSATKNSNYTCQDDHLKKSQIKRIISSSVEKTKILSETIDYAKSLAEDALSNAFYKPVFSNMKYINSDGPKDINKQVLNAFLKAAENDRDKQYIFDDGSFGGCQGGAKAAQTTTSNVIYLCPAFFGDPLLIRAKTLIHEFVHTLGYKSGIGSECVAMQIEFLVQLAAGHHPYESGYEQKCQSLFSTDEYIAEI